MDGDRDELLRAIRAAEAQLHATTMRWADPLPVPADLTIRQLQVLALLRSSPGACGQGLADELGVSTPTVSGIVDRMVTKGWVGRDPDPDDRRRVRLTLTGPGAQLLTDLEAGAQRAREVLLQRIDDDELAAVHRVVARLRDVAVQLDRERSDALGALRRR